MEAERPKTPKGMGAMPGKPHRVRDGVRGYFGVGNEKK
jgi:hypothetical protein